MFLKNQLRFKHCCKRFAFRFMYTKYCWFGFDSGSLAENFKGSGLVHRFEILKARFRFNDLKFKRFRFGSGSPKKSVCFRFAVQIRVRFDSLVKTLNFDKLNAIHEVMMGDKLLLLHMVAGAKLGNVPPPKSSFGAP